MLGRKIASGVIWNTLEEILKRSSGFFIKLILAKLLYPADFGIIGMAVVFISFIQVFNDIGMNAALIQRKDEDLEENDYHTSFWTGFFWSIFLYVFIYFFLSPFIANFYDEEKLIPVVRVLSISVLLSPIVSVQKAILTKSFNFKKLSFINSSTGIIAGVVAVIMAYKDFGVWALVFNAVAPTLMGIPLFFISTTYYPKFYWKKSSFNKIFGFGVFTMGSSLFIKLTSQFDYLLVGKLLGKTPLGIYTFAFIITEQMRGQIVSVFTKVMYPVFSKVQDDNVLLKKYYFEVLKIVALIIVPSMFLLIYFTDLIVLTFFGNKWEESIPIIQIFSVSVIVHMPLISSTALIRGSGKAKKEFNLQVFRALTIYVPCIWIGTYYYGILGTAWGHLIAKILTVFSYQHVLKNLFNISMKEILVSLKYPVIIGFLPFSILFFFKTDLDSWVGLVLYSLILLGSYYLFARSLIVKYKNTFMRFFQKK